MDVESLWLIFKHILFDAISTYAPIKQTHTKACLYPSFIHAALNKKLVLWHKRFSICGKVTYKKQALICDKLICKHHAAIKQRVIT